MQDDLVVRAQKGDLDASSALTAGRTTRLFAAARLILRDDRVRSGARGTDGRAGQKGEAEPQRSPASRCLKSGRGERISADTTSPPLLIPVRNVASSAHRATEIA